MSLTEAMPLGATIKDVTACTVIAIFYLSGHRYHSRRWVESLNNLINLNLNFIPASVFEK